MSTQILVTSDNPFWVDGEHARFWDARLLRKNGRWLKVVDVVPLKLPTRNVDELIVEEWDGPIVHYEYYPHRRTIDVDAYEYRFYEEVAS